MRKLLTSLLAMTLLASSSVPGSAAKRKKHHHYHGQYARTEARNGYGGRIERQKEYDSNKLPFGSHDWWEQMTREGRTVCCN